MSRAPWVLAKPEKAYAKPGEMFDSSLGWRFVNERFSAGGDLSRDGRMTYSMPETAEEVAERYEEITLLYTISEILGSVISLEQAARTILQEVARTLVVDRAARLEGRHRDRLLAQAGAGVDRPARGDRSGTAPPAAPATPRGRPAARHQRSVRRG